MESKAIYDPVKQTQRYNLEIERHTNLEAYKSVEEEGPKGVKHLRQILGGLPILILDINFDKNASENFVDELRDRGESLKEIHGKWEKLERVSESPWVKIHGERELQPYNKLLNTVEHYSRKKT